MMQMRLHNGLLYASVEVTYQGRSIVLKNMVVDTGSAATLVAEASVAPIGMSPEGTDVIRIVHGLTGTEPVASKQVDRLWLDDTLSVAPFSVQIAGMANHSDLDGILGLDFLMQVEAVLNLQTLDLTAAPE